MNSVFKKILPTLAAALYMHGGALAQSVTKVHINESPWTGDYYLAVEPESDSAEGVLLLLAGFGERPEYIFPETKLHNVAYANNILTIAFAGGNKLYADSVTQLRLNAVIKDVLSKYRVSSRNFVLGGYSAGGMIALRYVELCNEFPERFPIQPKGVFLVDSPIDIFSIWDSLEDIAKNNYSEPAVEEAVRAMGHIKNEYGIPRENLQTYSKLTAFSMNKAWADHEWFLKHTAVRAYHDVDIAWRLVQRNQAVHHSNYEVTAELINRLLLVGNTKAEFMQSFKTGYRSNGMRHPHSWSIVDEVECIQWMKGLVENRN